MKKTLLSLLVLIYTSTFLQGCAAVAATAGVVAIGAVVFHDRRTTGSIVEDQNIEIKASRLLGKKGELTETSHINVISYNHIVLLTGQAPSQQAKTRAEELIRSITHVKRVHNQIQLKENTSFATRSNDVYLTSKIKSKMVSAKDVDPTQIKIHTEDSTVYLMGITTEAEAQLAIDIARHTKGVKKVVHLFEYFE